MLDHRRPMRASNATLDITVLLQVPAARLHVNCALQDLTIRKRVLLLAYYVRLELILIPME